MNIPLTNSHGWPVNMDKEEALEIALSGYLIFHTIPDANGGREIDRLSNIWIKVAGKDFNLSYLRDEKGRYLKDIILDEAGEDILSVATESGDSE